MSDEPVAELECRDVTVTYGDVVALRGVSVAFAPRRIHAVVGQNGAGKTTFARVCAGIVRPVSGELRIAGKAVPTGRVNQARASGVELVHQSFALPPSFTVAEAMEFGSQRRGGRLFSRGALEARWAPHIESLGIKVRMRDRIRDLPIETQQAVEIARALVAKARVLILDEPTAVLSPSGIDTLFERLRGLRESGVTIILILHKIREVLSVAESVTVLRGGELVKGPIATTDIDAGGIASAIIGSGASEAGPLTRDEQDALVGAGEQTHGAAVHARATHDAPPVLALNSVRTAADREGPALQEINLAIDRGEIVGVAGVEGNGQRTLVRALAGLVPMEGEIRLGDENASGWSPIQMRAAGLRIIPFERNVEGLSLSSALWVNWSVRQLLLGSPLRLISPARIQQAARRAFEQWDVRFASTGQPARALSGGNAQKVILSREIDDQAAVIVAAQPTRGLDIGATAFVWRSLREARSRGSGILLISSDLDELFDISDRIVVMLSGRIVAEFAPPYRLDLVGAAMTGVGR